MYEWLDHSKLSKTTGSVWGDYLKNKFKEMISGEYWFYNDVARCVGLNVIEIEDDILFKISHGYSKKDKEKVKAEAEKQTMIEGLMNEI